MSMKKNMGSLDRGLRVTGAAVIAVLIATDVITGTLAIVLAAVAVLFVLTSSLGSCPAYLPFGWSTRRSESGG
jgi:hypothetical protein